MTDFADEMKCPVCGKSNSCEYSTKNKTKQNSCWCDNSEYQFPVDLFTRFPDKFKNKACICESCAQIYRTNLPKNDLSEAILNERRRSSKVRLDTFKNKNDDKNN